MKHFIFILLLVIVFYSRCDDKCRALVMSGAGSQGAYQSAVIQGLINYMPDPEVNLRYDVVAGVSAGSLNALGMSAFKPEEITQAAEFLFTLWTDVSEYQVIGNWPNGGLIRGLIYEQGVFNLNPGKVWVSDAFKGKTVNRAVSFSATDSKKGIYEVFEYNATGDVPDDFIETAFASSSIPLVFPPTKIGDYELIDGGCVWNVDLITGVRRCKDLGFKEKDIIVDIITVGNTDIECKRDLSKFTAMDHYFRSREINGFYNYMNDFRTGEDMFPDVEYRFLIHPSETLPGGMLPLDFSREAIAGCFVVGDKDAFNAVQLGSGGYGKVLLEFSDRRLNGEDVNLSDMIDEALALKGQKDAESQ